MLPIAMKMLDQFRRASFWGRYWSLLVALALPVLVFFFFDFLITEMLVSLVSTALLLHAWRRQIRNSRSTWQSLLWTSLLLLPMLCAVWLGLNVIRGSTYDYAADYQRHLGDYHQSAYWYAVYTQDWIIWALRIDVLVCLLLAATVFMRMKTRATDNPI